MFRYTSIQNTICLTFVANHSSSQPTAQHHSHIKIASAYFHLPNRHMIHAFLIIRQPCVCHTSFKLFPLAVEPFAKNVVYSYA